MVNSHLEFTSLNYSISTFTFNCIAGKIDYNACSFQHLKYQVVSVGTGCKASLGHEALYEAVERLDSRYGTSQLRGGHCEVSLSRRGLGEAPQP